MKSGPYEKRRLKLLATEAKGPRVLDVGFAQLPNPWLSVYNTTGLDRSVPENAPPAYRRVIQGDASRIDDIFRGDRFESVVAGEVIEHLEDPYDFLRRIRQVLPPGGRLILSTPNPLAFPVLIAELIWSRSFFYSSDHTYYFLPRWMSRLLESTGYEIIRVRPVGLWIPFGYIPCPISTLSYQLIYVAQPRED